MSETIHLLIRNKYRPALFRRCVNSVLSQSYKDVKLIVACDSTDSHWDAIQVLKGGPLNYEIFMVTTPVSKGHYWNLYCNELKAKVVSGFMFYLDNDDALASPTVLQELSEHLSPDHGTIVQFLRNNKPKPNDRLMARNHLLKGHCGGGCMVLHHSHKNLADWQGIEAADYYWMKDVESKLPLKFVPLIVQIADMKNNGKS